MRRLFTLLLLLALALGASPAAAGDELVLRVRIAPSKTATDPWEQTQYYSGGVRITDDPRFRTIIDLDKRTLTVINKAKQTYSVTTFDEIKKRREAAAETVKKLPGPVREMVHADDKVELKPTGKTEKIVGYEAKEYSFEAPGALGSVWIAESLDYGPRADDWAKVAPNFGGEDSPAGHLEAAITAKKGVPLRRIVTTSPLPMVVIDVLEVRHEPAPAEMKAIPAGYEKVDMPNPRAAKANTTSTRSPVPVPSNIPPLKLKPAATPKP